MRATPKQIAEAWAAWHSRHGGRLGPGPGFVEAINAALNAEPPICELCTARINAGLASTGRLPKTRD